MTVLSTDNLTEEQRKHCIENINRFEVAYANKYADGQEAHGGNMWDMGAYQALENMEQEVLDSWSYCRQIRKCLDEIRETLYESKYHEGLIENVREILDRVKED